MNCTDCTETEQYSFFLNLQCLAENLAHSRCSVYGCWNELNSVGCPHHLVWRHKEDSVCVTNPLPESMSGIASHLSYTHLTQYILVSLALRLLQHQLGKSVSQRWSLGPNCLQVSSLSVPGLVQPSCLGFSMRTPQWPSQSLCRFLSILVWTPACLDEIKFLLPHFLCQHLAFLLKLGCILAEMSEWLSLRMYPPS